MRKLNRFQLIQIAHSLIDSYGGYTNFHASWENPSKIDLSLEPASVSYYPAIVLSLYMWETDYEDNWIILSFKRQGWPSSSKDEDCFGNLQMSELRFTEALESKEILVSNETLNLEEALTSPSSVIRVVAEMELHENRLKTSQEGKE